MSARTYSPGGTNDQHRDLRATRDRLELALENSKKSAEPVADGDGTDATAVALESADLLEQAESGVSGIGEWVEENTTIEESQEDLADFRLVVDEATDLIDTVDIAAIPDTVDAAELPSAIDMKAIPDAIADRDPTAPVDFSRLVKAIELGELLQAVDLPALLKEKTELDDTVSQSRVEQDKRSEAANEENEDEPTLRKGLRGVYEKIDDVSDTSQSGADAFSGSKRSAPTPPTYSTIPSERPDIRGIRRFSTVPRR